MTLRTDISWTHPSVLEFAGNKDPIVAVEERAKLLAFTAFDQGWTGPPYDPIELAKTLGMNVTASEDVRDAMVEQSADGAPHVIFNPLQPRTRINFSVAHEIMHTCFADFGDRPRYRLGEKVADDDWQLEMLCNIGAAELLMPAGELGPISPEIIDIDWVLEKRKELRVSTEALLLRLVRLSNFACAIFCASRVSQVDAKPKIRLDYLVTSRAWSTQGNPSGFLVSEAISQCTAIGYTAKARENWSILGEEARVECVGLPGYDGQLFPRVAGIIVPIRELPRVDPTLEFLTGNALEPRNGRPAVIVHLVNDRTPNWSPIGFAGAVKKKWPSAQIAFRQWVESQPENLALGNTFAYEVEPNLFVFTIVAQAGYGPSTSPRLKYEALQQGLVAANEFAHAKQASLHMPRIGAGQAGGKWDVIQSLIEDELCDRGRIVTIYDLPEGRK